MKLFEMYAQPIGGYQDASTDNSKVKWKETRKTKLTLRQIRKLRKMIDVRTFEKTNNLSKVRTQYKPVETDQPTM